MGAIDVNPISARTQATKICQASDRLSISKTVTFSENTTISGNSNAKSTFESLAKGTIMAQQLLNRDVQAIQSVISTFTRTDEKIKNQLEVSSVNQFLSGGAFK